MSRTEEALLQLLKDSARRGQQANNVDAHFDTVLAVLANRKAAPACRRLAYSFLRGCKGPPSTLWRIVAPFILIDVVSTDEEIATGALRLTESMPTQEMIVILPSIANALAGILGDSQGQDRIRCEAVMAAASLLFSPERAELRMVHKSILLQMSGTVVALALDPSPAVSSSAFQSLAAALAHFLPSRAPSSFHTPGQKGTLSYRGYYDFESSFWACGTPALDETLPYPLQKAPPFASSLYPLGSATPLATHDLHLSEIVERATRWLEQRLRVLAERQKSFPRQSKLGTSHLLTKLCCLSMHGRCERSYQDSAMVFETCIVPLLAEDEGSLVIEGAQGIVSLAPYMPSVVSRHMLDAVEALLGLAERTNCHMGKEHALQLAIQCFTFLSPQRQMANATSLFVASLWPEKYSPLDRIHPQDRKCRIQCLLTVMWTSMWSTAIVASINDGPPRGGNMGRWGPIDEETVIDLMSVEPDKPSARKVDVVCCLCSSFLLPPPTRLSLADSAKDLIAAAQRHVEGFSLGVLELFHSSLRWEWKEGGCVAAVYLRLLERCCARALSRSAPSPSPHAESSGAGVGCATRVVEILQSLICSFQTVPLNSSRTRALCFLCEHLPIKSSDPTSLVNRSTLAGLMAPHLGAGDQRDQESAAQISRLHLGFPSSSPSVVSCGSKNLADASLVSQCMLKAVSRQPSLAAGFLRLLCEFLETSEGVKTDPPLKQRLQVAFSQIDSVANGSLDICPAYERVSLSTSAPPSEEVAFLEAERKQAVCQLEQEGRIFHDDNSGGIHELLEECAGGCAGGRKIWDNIAGVGLVNNAKETVLSGANDPVYVKLGQAESSGETLQIWVVMRNRSPFSLQKPRFSLSFDGGLASLETASGASTTCADLPPSWEAHELCWRVPLRLALSACGSIAVHLAYTVPALAHSGAETSVTFRRYILPASFVLSPHQPSPISDSVLGVGECDQQSFSRIWAAMGTSQFFFGKSESTCRFEGMKSSSGTCGKFLLNMNSFAHVGIKGRALDTAGSGLNFQVAGMARTLWNDYFAMAVTGTRSQNADYWDLVIEFRSSDELLLHLLVSAHKIHDTVKNFLGGDVNIIGRGVPRCYSTEGEETKLMERWTSAREKRKVSTFFA